MKLPVGRRLRRVVADQVVGARVARDLLHAHREIVPVDDRAAVGVLGQHAECVHRRAEVLRIGLDVDALVDVELEAGQSTRIDGVNRHVLLVRDVVDVAQIGVHVEPGRPRRAVFVDVVQTDHRLAVRRIAGAGHRRVPVAHLRWNDVGVALADENQCFPAFLQRAHVDDQGLERRQRDLVADPLDDFRRVVRVILLELVLRVVFELAPEELLQPARNRRMVACHADRCGRFQRIHHADHVGRPHLRLDELHQLAADGHARAAAHVIVIQEDGEQADVVARSFGFLVVVGADLLRRLLDRFGPASVELHELEGLDLLRLAVLTDIEVGRL